MGTKMMDIPTTFLRWVARECPWQVERVAGMAEYLASRCRDDVACVRSATREANTDGPSRGKTPRELGLKPARKTEAPPARAAAPPGDLFSLAASMREAAK